MTIPVSILEISALRRINKPIDYPVLIGLLAYIKSKYIPKYYTYKDFLYHL